MKPSNLPLVRAVCLCVWFCVAATSYAFTITSTEFLISGGWTEDNDSGHFGASSTGGAVLETDYRGDHARAGATVSSFGLNTYGYVQNNSPAPGEPGYVSYAAVSLDASAVTRFRTEEEQVLLTLRGTYGPYIILEAYEDPLSHMGLIFKDLTSSQTLLDFEWYKDSELWESLYYGVAYDLNPSHEYELTLWGSFSIWAGTLDYSDINAKVELAPVAVPDRERSVVLLALVLCPLLLLRLNRRGFQRR